MYYLYILVSESSGKYYVGITDDPGRRLIEYNTSERNTYTPKYRPWKIAAIFECGAFLGEARKFENFKKKQKSKTLLEKMISNKPLSGMLTQLVKVPHLRD